MILEKEKNKLNKKNNRLTKEQFLLWKVSLLEFQNAQVKASESALNELISEKDSQIASLRGHVLKEKTTAALNFAEEKKKEFQETKKNIEKESGLSLSDASIDLNTYEVRSLKGD